MEKIDSTSGHYLIHISEANKFKGIIVSKKEGPAKTKKRRARQKITPGQAYEFNVEKYKILRVLNRTSFETETGGKGGIIIDGVVVWKASDDFELYECFDLRGLYFKKK